MTDGDDRLSALPRWLMHRGRLVSGQPDPNGQWVRWTDVAPLLAALTADLTAAAHARTTLQRELDEWRTLVPEHSDLNAKRIGNLMSAGVDEIERLREKLAAAEQARITLQAENEQLRHAHADQSQEPLLAASGAAPLSEASSDDLAWERLLDMREVPYDLCSGAAVTQILRHAKGYLADYEAGNVTGVRLSHWLRTTLGTLTAVAQAEGDRRALQIALQRYGRHDLDCLEIPCTCGFHDALKDELARVDRQPDSTLALPQPAPDGDHR